MPASDQHTVDLDRAVLFDAVEFFLVNLGPVDHVRPRFVEAKSNAGPAPSMEPVEKPNDSEVELVSSVVNQTSTAKSETPSSAPSPSTHPRRATTQAARQTRQTVAGTEADRFPAPIGSLCRLVRSVQGINPMRGGPRPLCIFESYSIRVQPNLAIQRRAERGTQSVRQ